MSGQVWASGFGLYQGSSKSQALGGAVVGRAVDAAANFYNPATLSDLTNITVSVGFITEHPRARMKVDDGSSIKMDPGVFWLPHLGLAIPLPFDFTFGLMAMPEYGLGSRYDSTWDLVNSSRKTTVTSFTVNPNLSYAITEDWSIAAGARLMFFDFEQYSQPMPGQVYNRLKGDNGMSDCGWQVGTRYKVLDNLALGLVYKSRTTFNVEGKSVTDGLVNKWVSAETELEMPDSITGGFNWDITPTWHLGGSAMWTHWATLDVLHFNLGGQDTPCELHWEDTWRFTLAPSWDFAEDWTWMWSYGYETDCTHHQLSTMLPATDRHLLATGFAWQFCENFELAFSYSIILMDGKTSHARDATKRIREYTAHRGLSHSAGLTLTYRF